MDPITLAAILMAGSVLFKNQAQKQVQKRQSGLMSDERIRQDRLRSEARARNEEERAKTTRPAQDQAREAAEAKASDRLEGAVTTPADVGSYAQTEPSAPTEVKDEIARKFVDALETARTHAKNAAKLRSYGDVQFQNDIAGNRLGQDIGRLADLSAGSTDVLGTEMEAAKLAGSKYRFLGDVAGAGGDISMMYGMTRPKPKMPPAVPQGNPYVQMHSGYSRGY
jgi:hypothetical protein